ncbi:lipopolysaccharide/colanic/teichoic acid biosynthesis glycosyltransferase [Nakamurella sp. UYEF19]
MSIPVIVPLMVLIALSVGTSGRPLFFQTRVGAGGRI